MLLATRWEPPDLPAARRWYQRAADAGHTSAMAGLGWVYGMMGDLDGALSAWTQVLDQASPDRAAAVALRLAAVEALIGYTNRARLLLLHLVARVGSCLTLREWGRCGHGESSCSGVDAA